ncbi:DNA repair protein RecN [Mycoavidus sp. B2-EB]|uniref:DNA repair protein RecN n=1 Tax=Mycoavidus sp. B2-EB TaxID=2651972 RepID=UPI0016253C14|nr:DNA repair protein RecN [Mycoavidus sp. B2-EB]BBO58997.1 DNA repair protein RecN [Mycoavidus sp. B2-EB]
MLRYLSIRDFVIVNTLKLEFEPGFTVFSGETGAGKSILIDALTLALGARADASVVRAGQPRTEITAEFMVSEQVRYWLNEHALDDAEHDNLLLRRVIDSGGRSRAFINGTPATLAQLREIGEMLVDLHGQHAHQLLMRPQAQRTLFDLHAGLAPLAHETAQAWHRWHDAIRATQTAHDANREIQLEREQLIWQLDELDQLAPQPGEWESTHTEHRRLTHAASLIHCVQHALEVLAESDQALLPRLGALMNQLRKQTQIDDRLADALTALEPAEIQISEAVHTLNHYAQQLELDPARLAQIETRLNALHSSARKFHVTPETLPAEHAARRARLKEFEAATNLEQLHADAASAQAHYEKLARQLSQARAQAAQKLSAAVTTTMQDLAMAGGRFEVALVPLTQMAEESHPLGRAHGFEQIEFRVASHPSVPLRPLAKVASGGELARISLALSVITSTANPTPTLIFDEVDSGIGGAVAEVVGRLLHQLGQQRQVLCVTHLPQVAARGDVHLQVTKQTTSAQQIVSLVTSLDPASRVEEIARMLGGIEITSTTRQHAQEMLTV